MQIKKLNPENLGLEEDWVGNNAAFKCPNCEKIFIVSGHLHKNGRKCPKCNILLLSVMGVRIKGVLQVLNGENR